MPEKRFCTDCNRQGHHWYDCQDPDVLAKKRERHPSLYPDDKGFDIQADELKFERDEKDIFE